MLEQKHRALSCPSTRHSVRTRADFSCLADQPSRVRERHSLPHSAAAVRRRTSRKKLALRGDESLANLDAAERRLNLPRRTCTITDDNRDTIFVNKVQPKPTSPRHDYGRSSPIATPAALGSPHRAAFPYEPVAMSSWSQQQPPSHIYEEAQVT
jgi:hypothetical protein